MALRYRHGDSGERLDPPPRRWPRLRWSGAARGAAAAALVVLAAVVLLTPATPTPAGDRDRPCTAPRLPGTPPRGTVGFPLRLADPAVLTVLRPGHRVDVLAPPRDGLAADLVAADVLVLQTVAGDSGTAVVYLAARPDQARTLASVAVDLPVSVTVRAP